MLSIAWDAAKAGVVGNIGALALDEATHEGEFEVVRHDVRWAGYLAFLEKELEVGHSLVLELLEPLVELHVILVCASVVVLTAAGLPPVRFCLLKRTLDLTIEQTVPFRGGLVELDCEDAGLDTQLENGSTASV